MSGRPRSGRYFVYVVRCTDGTYYTGSAKDVRKRIQQHNAGDGAKYLRGKGPVELVYLREYRQRTDALRGEESLKRLTRRQKEALIGGQRPRNRTRRSKGVASPAVRVP